MVVRVTTLLLWLHACHGCTVWKVSPHGFSADILTFLSVFPVFNGHNGSFYLDSRSNRHSCTASDISENGWFDFFDTDSSVLRPWNAVDAAGCRVLTSGDARAFMSTVHRSSEYMQGVALRKLWRFRPQMQQLIDKTMSRIRSLPLPTVGFHIRGGDELLEDALLGRSSTTPQQYIDTYVEAHGQKGGTCTFVGDDRKLMDEAKDLAESQIGCQSYLVRPSEVDVASHNQDSFNKLPLLNRCRATLELLVDIEVLSHADYFIGSWTSGLPGLVDMLRWEMYGKDRTTFLDVASHHEDGFNTVRAYLKDAPVVS